LPAPATPSERAKSSHAHCNFHVTLFFYVTGKAIGLPDEFLAFAEGSKGGGVIQVRRIMNI
jgi:hypothetical protein